MEENIFPQLPSRKKNQTLAANKTKSEFFRSFFKTQLHRFSKNCEISSFPADQKRLFINLSLECWSKPPDKRTQKDIDDIIAVLEQEGIFFEIKNNRLVLKHFAKTIKIEHFQTNGIIFDPSHSHEKIMKIIRGTVVLKTNMDSLTGLERVRGNYIEEPQNFNSGKKNYAIATSLVSVFSIDKQIFEEGISTYLTQKAILRMFQKTPLFSKFTLKEIEAIYQCAKEKNYFNKQIFFKHQQLDASQMYYIVQGQVAILLNNSHQSTKVCTISDGSLFGQENMFLNQSCRPYTAVAQSCQVKILCIQYQDCKDSIKRYHKSIENSMKDINYQLLIQHRLNNYNSAIRKGYQIRDLFHSKSVHQVNCSPKTAKLSQMVKIGQSIHQRIQSIVKCAQKRNLIQENVKSDYINFSMPLFNRSDFPQLKGSLKRFANEEKRAKQQLELPKLNKLR